MVAGQHEGEIEVVVSGSLTTVQRSVGQGTAPLHSLSGREPWVLPFVLPHRSHAQGGTRAATVCAAAGMEAGVRTLRETLDRGMANALHSGVHPLRLPLPTDPAVGWRATHLFDGATPVLNHLSCHASTLLPGTCPHPPHRHEDEELLLMLDGEAELLLADSPPPDGARRHRLTAGRLVYYPTRFAHTLTAAGDRPATYLMLRWAAPPVGDTSRTLGFREIELAVGNPPGDEARALRTVTLLEGTTGCLPRLQAHVSHLPHGAGYPPHADRHDVALIVLEGEVQTLERRAGPLDVVFYRAGEPHGMANPGSIPARYVVFEFHGMDTPPQPWPVRRPLGLVRALLPARVRRRLRRLLVEGS